MTRIESDRHQLLPCFALESNDTAGAISTFMFINMIDYLSAGEQNPLLTTMILLIVFQSFKTS